MKESAITDVPSYGLPSRILCKVVKVMFQAEPKTDELYAQISLARATECDKQEGSVFSSEPEKVPASFFEKRLNLSDTSVHGGCYLPKRHVDRMFPPLDLAQDNPTQELSAIDLHGATWHFRHNYHGTPKRHFLTAGWSHFVNEKKLVAGDNVIFLRGQNQLFVGVRRAISLQKPSIDLTCVSMCHGVLATTLQAIQSEIAFTVHYHPRMSLSRFMVAYDEFMKSLEVTYSPGMRVEMLIDNREESGCNLTKFSGIIDGVEDIDPIRWPGSEWRCLKVQWNATSSRHVLPGRVSPWNIQPLGFAIQNYTKVLKHGTTIGRYIDLSRFDGYEGFVSELDRMFGFEGTLVNRSSGWLVTYVNGVGDKIPIGGFSWSQFRGVIRKLFICPNDVVKGKMVHNG